MESIYLGAMLLGIGLAMFKYKGIDIGKQTATCEQALYELKDCILSSETFDELKICVVVP